MLNTIGVEIQRPGGGTVVEPFVDSPYVDPENDYVDESAQDYVKRSLFDSVYIIPSPI